MMERHYKKQRASQARAEYPGAAPGSHGRDEGAPACDWPGCLDSGLHRAPRSRHQIRVYHWFCLEHVRIFNKSWNYYRGMTESEIETSIRSDVTWNRPTWPQGSLAGAGAGSPRAGGKKNHWFGDGSGTMGDPFGFFGRAERPGKPGRPRVAPTEERALRVLDLKFPITVKDVKARYKTLVKRHHPDVNGGDKAAEERLKQINQAYETVMSCLAS